MVFQQKEFVQKELLGLQDLLRDEKSDDISEYLSLSINKLGDNTQVKVTTIEESPTTYLSILNGVSITGLQQIIDVVNE